MERGQGPLPKQAMNTGHLLRCFSPPAELCSPAQFPAPHQVHVSSHAPLWNHSGNGHQDDLHQPPPLSSPSFQCTPCFHMQDHPQDLLNGLQLKHNIADKAADDCVSANTTTTHDTHASSNALFPSSDNAAVPVLQFETCLHTKKSGHLAQSMVSFPFHCKQDMASAKSRNALLASPPPHFAEDSEIILGAQENGLVSMNVVDKPIYGFEANGNSHQSRTEQGGLDEGTNALMVKQLKKSLQKPREADGDTRVHSLAGDVVVGLKLGKRTYFGESSVNGVVDESKQALHGSTGNSIIGGSIASNGSGGNAKKMKSSSPSACIPRCQAEDCKIDLTSAKDYHRRHKVCEWHSKSSKAKVANLDQRFCQQCSRFHVLSEFDEGKRSCRRRLAGHNERRRKQQPEPFPLLSAASYACFTGSKHLFSMSLMDQPHLFEHKHIRGPDFEGLLKPKLEPAENFQPSELHHFIQASHRGDEHLLPGGVAPQALVLASTNGANVGSPPSPACLITFNHPQPSLETLVSGCALSLLSSSAGFTNTSRSVSAALGVSSASFNGCMLENHHGTSSRCTALSSASSGFPPNEAKAIKTFSFSCDNEISLLSGSERAAVPPSYLNVNQVQPSRILSVEGRSTFPANHSTNDQSDGVPPIPDLMQVSLARSGTPQLDLVEHQITDLEELSMFARQSLM